ncbi:xylulokinase [Salinibacterium amurskyense]|uniref:Xylulose kinase n=1 Tax=Salinibacterium amurskyense TaxID=205941 RepID=A0A2M9D450_9MICO|nr:xylulokinase [Salinibacterium amurskyense]PJJ78823.1 xylulokinase [Salinibacterium amurskyense]RLQ80886.1 xylulokinase [Salinibacterium amurskyense]GHD83597.1 xylulokinase [Salinibacterium amurskyense]
MTLVAGIDSSTQSCKIVIVDAATGALVRTGRASHPAGTEVDPNAWWVALNEAITEAGGLDDVSAISVGGQQHGMVVLDAAGRVIRPALLWNDTRSAAAADALSTEFPDLAERTGSKPVASFTSTKLRWLRDAEPENAALVAAVCLPHDWLTWRLRGFGPENPELTELVTDRSDASGTGYFNSVTNEYDLDVLGAALGRDASAITLPRIVAPGESAGTVVAPLAATTAISVACGAGDNAGAALGLGARAGDVVVSIGTSGTVFAVATTQIPDSKGTVAGFADASGNFLPLVATMNAARVLDSTAALLDVDHNELGALALESEPGAHGLVLQPYFEGERTPNLPDATATLFGMTLASTTRPSLARAAIEGLLCGLADGLDALVRQGVTAERILLIGGAAQNPAVSTIASQVFAVPVVVPEPGEYVALGAAAQAAWVLDGTRPDWTIATVAEPASDHRPVIREQYARYAD